MVRGTKIDLEQLSKEIQRLKVRQALYEVLRDELKKIGHWKYKRRGDPAKGFRLKGKGKDNQ
jgi:hypothetical protein